MTRHNEPNEELPQRYSKEIESHKPNQSGRLETIGDPSASQDTIFGPVEFIE